ncbi:MAG: hypothetical protein QNL62_14145 [Gammaproteobacteria bacterium]|nr:hypothetical protein [Gammaproteobacteria bacterium]
MKTICRLTTAVTLLSIGLSSCGGGGTGSGTNVDNNPVTTTAVWTQLKHPDPFYTGTPSGINRNGQEIYLSYGTSEINNSIKTTDGKAFTEFDAPVTFTQLLFVDDIGQLYFGDLFNSDTYTSVDAINYSPITNAELPYFINGDSSILIGNDGNGLFKYTNGATVKTQIDINNDSIIDASDSTVIAHKPAFNGQNTFVAISSTGGLIVTNDAGSSWFKTLESEGAFFAVTGNPQQANIFYAAKSGAIFKSTDSGNTWSAVTSPLLDGQAILEFLDIYLCDDGTILAWGLPNSQIGTFGQVYESSDNGLRWNAIGGPTGVTNTSIIGNQVGAQQLNANDSYYIIKSGFPFYIMPR